ncbi:hypothetical protein BJF85_14435 [Saccharomonospora sp. CUA-673]|uniref:CGNR zinc finger domain-containing protein n=1 Tax=Saccharomonospora sp. CUA-673 TaxID=1904969 RepID=UPI000959E5AC|nr:CGNR zinc finger domain-containing protein [Saccharomonospora sp. CUA-673]OLT47831.1 hypothetical protein BJF85_14435 [Saccharomonospora sp. CUA-673]
MDFDSHTSGVVAATVALVNALTPGHARGREHAPSAAEMLSSAREALGAVGDERPVQGDVDDLAAAAGRLRVVFEHVEAGDMDAACRHVNGLLRETRAAPELSRHGDGPWHLHFHTPDADFVPSWEAPMATSLAVVLGNPYADRLGVCSAPACDRVYVDTSRNGTRRFCGTTCQNRVKAAQFRNRRAAGSG